LHEIEQLTLWDVNDLMLYWQDYPPTHVLVAAYLMGGTKRSKRVAENTKVGELPHAIAILGGSAKGRLPEMYRC
jgi:hypothetical protein